MLILKLITTDPPSVAPADHCKPSVDAVRSDVFSTKLIGASGFVIIVAPLPLGETFELPLMLVALTVAKISSAKLNKYGAEVRVDKGTTH